MGEEVKRAWLWLFHRRHWTSDQREVRTAVGLGGTRRLFWANVTPTCMGCGRKVIWLEMHYRPKHPLPLLAEEYRQG